jgi:phage/conjugal plasmid C-4 type zinc finger TraR family protein
MDALDRAADYAEKQRQAAIKQITNRPRPTTASAAACQDCGDPIPAARQKAVPGCSRCTLCQSAADAAR